MRQPYMEMIINETSSRKGIALRGVGNKVPSPLVSIQFIDTESAIQTSFKVTLHISGNQNKSYHVGSLEMLLYEFAKMNGDSIIPCYIAMGWTKDGELETDADGQLQVLEVQGQFIEFTAAVKNSYMEYVITGVGTLTSNGNNKGIAFPAINGNYKPSDCLEAALNYIQADSAFDYDIDHDDEVVPIYRPAQVTSLTSFVYGDGERQGLIQQSYCDGSRSSAYRLPGRLTSGDLRRAGYSNSQIKQMLGETMCNSQRSASSYSFSIVEPTFHRRGVIRYKNNTNLANYVNKEILLYGAQNTNILSLTATYNGITQQLYGSGATVQTGLALGLDGSVLTNDSNRTNSYSASAPSMYSAGNVLNNLNAISTQFNTEIQVTIVGSPKLYKVGNSVRLVVYTRGTLNPITGTYQIMKVSHLITGTSYTTTLNLKRLDPITANNTVAAIAGTGSGTPKINGSSISALPGGKPYFGKPYQNIMNILRRGLL